MQIGGVEYVIFFKENKDCKVSKDNKVSKDDKDRGKAKGQGEVTKGREGRSTKYKGARLSSCFL